MNVRWWKLKNRWHNRKQPKTGGATMSVVITRKDGHVENLGVVSRSDVTFQPHMTQGGESDSDRTD